MLLGSGLVKICCFSVNVAHCSGIAISVRLFLSQARFSVELWMLNCGNMFSVFRTIF